MMPHTEIKRYAERKKSRTNVLDNIMGWTHSKVKAANTDSAATINRATEWQASKMNFQLIQKWQKRVLHTLKEEKLH